MGVMMTIPRDIKSQVFSVGGIDWDRRLFDELIPLPDGTSYNSYLVKGCEKVALVDTVNPPFVDVLMENLGRLDVDVLDYVVVNHAEQDHSGSLPLIHDRYPKAEVIVTPRCKELLMSHLHLPSDVFKVVGDGDTLSLGDKTLKFVYTPWVHWPETMSTYLVEDGILFSCDFFGSHMATSNLFADPFTVYEPAKSYYAQIMMPFRKIITKNMDKLDELDLEIIAPSHGPLYSDPNFIMDAYRDWTSEDVNNQVVIPYTSMHGSTKKMVEHLVCSLMERDIEVQQFDLSQLDLGKLAMALVDAATLVVGTCTFLAGPHPLSAHAAFLVNALRPKLKFVSVVGSYGWGGKTVEVLQGMIPNLKAEMLDPVLAKGHPNDEDFEALDKLADQILKKHEELNLQSRTIVERYR